MKLVPNTTKVINNNTKLKKTILFSVYLNGVFKDKIYDKSKFRHETT